MEYLAAGLLLGFFFREYLMYRERREWAAERRLLMVRVQTPEAAVRMDTAAATKAPKVVGLPYDDDDAFHAYRDELINGD